MKRALGLAVLTAVVVACSSTDDDGSGTVRFTTYGEDYIEKEIPAADVEDGWVIEYERFLVTFHDVSVAAGDSAPVARMAVSKLFNHKIAGDKRLVEFRSLPARQFDRVSYRIAPAVADTTLGDGVTDADKQLMLSNGYSMYVEATATKGAVSKRYKWGFALDTLYDRCKGEVAGKETDGTVVTNGGTDSIQLTIHGDHLYYDDLQAKEAKVRFDNIAAADANDDGEITLEELAAVKLASFPTDGSKGTYGTGSAAGINDLRSFVEALSRTVGHFRGEGECFARAR
jgi:hypothetical protein